MGSRRTSNSSSSISSPCNKLNRRRRIKHSKCNRRGMQDNRANKHRNNGPRRNHKTSTMLRVLHPNLSRDHNRTRAVRRRNRTHHNHLRLNLHSSNSNSPSPSHNRRRTHPHKRFRNLNSRSRSNKPRNNRSHSLLLSRASRANLKAHSSSR